MILDNRRELITWLRGLPYYYETERQIFVHAGIDETYPAFWREVTEPYVFVGKFPAATGTFPKDIIAGHVAASTVAGNREHKGVFFDGKSHYYIDGSVQRTGRLLCLVYDENAETYYEYSPEDSTTFPLKNISLHQKQHRNSEGESIELRHFRYPWSV